MSAPTVTSSTITSRWSWPWSSAWWYSESRAVLALGAAGVTSAELGADAPALMLLGMGVTMTVPMVAWMRYRGHGWAPSNEMAASMLIPTVGVIALLWGSPLERTASATGVRRGACRGECRGPSPIRLATA